MNIMDKIVQEIREEEMSRKEARRRISNIRINKKEADQILRHLDEQGMIKLDGKKVRRII